MHTSHPIKTDVLIKPKVAVFVDTSGDPFGTDYYLVELRGGTTLKVDVRDIYTYNESTTEERVNQ